VHIREEGWKELKVGCVFAIQQQPTRDKHTGEIRELAHAVANTYVAHLGGPTVFGEALWAEARRRHWMQAPETVVLGDGATWIWNLTADKFFTSRQVVDWYHAKLHLTQAATALHGEGTAAARRWLRQQETPLLQGHAERLARTLLKLAQKHARCAEALRREAGYFQDNYRRMQYLALREEGFQSEAVHEALDLCLSCKACKTECPVQVDMTAYKSEYLAQRYKGRLHPLNHYVFGFADKLARLGALTPALTNMVLTGPITSPLIKHIVRVAQPRQLPSLAPKPYTKLRKTNASLPQTPGAPGLDSETGESTYADQPQSCQQTVLLWPDTWNNYYHPQSLQAAESILTEAGFSVRTPTKHICCGRALYDFGHLDTARSYLANVLDTMTPEIEAGLPFIFLEPSCASVFKDELPELFTNDPRAKKLRELVWLIGDWLQSKAPNFAANRLAGKTVLIHGHCHHKAVFGGPKAEIALLRAAGANVQPIESSCCGMAGPFGFEADKFEVSKTIANLSLIPAVTNAPDDAIIVADGFSCREQIAQLGHKHALHFAEALVKQAT